MRSSRQTGWLVLTALLAAVILTGLLTVANLRYGRQQPGGHDFLVLWEGTRTFLGEGISPYSDEMTARIADRLAEAGIEMQQADFRFFAPLYSIFLVLPFSLVSDFQIARALWMTVLELGLIALAVFSFRLVRWRAGPVMAAVFVLFTVFFFHGLRPLIAGSLSIFVALVLAAAFLAIRNRSDEIAGILFGLSAVIPQLVIVLLIFILIWSIRRGRWKIPIWSGMTIVILSAVAALLLPDWINQNLTAFLRNPGAGAALNPAAAFGEILPALGSRIGSIFSILVIILMLVEWWFARSDEFRSFLWAACFTLTASQWSGIRTSPDNFIVLIPALALVFSALEERWRGAGRAVSLASMVVLFAGIWGIFLSIADAGLLSPESPILFIPLPLYLLLSLYWVRWWAVQPPDVWYDLLSQERR